MTSKTSPQTAKQVRLAMDEYIDNYDNSPSLTKIAEKYGIRRQILSEWLKSQNIIIVNHQNKLKFNENIFDCIDTEEKAYWLGFIFADGYISSGSEFAFELSLKDSDVNHLIKFNIFTEHIDSNHVKIGEVKCNDIICSRCRWGVKNKHLWETLNNYGCTPRKSLTLEFPDESIFKDKSLIRHFIRGYVDGDGCLTYADSSHKHAQISILGTEDFLTRMKKYLPLKFDYVLGYKNYKDITKKLQITGINAFELCYYLYKNSKIYLDRKYDKYLEFCRLYEESYRGQSGNIGETPEMDNTEISSEIKESEPSYSVDGETYIWKPITMCESGCYSCQIPKENGTCKCPKRPCSNMAGYYIRI